MGRGEVSGGGGARERRRANVDGALLPLAWKIGRRFRRTDFGESAGISKRHASTCAFFGDGGRRAGGARSHAPTVCPAVYRARISCAKLSNSSLISSPRSSPWKYTAMSPSNATETRGPSTYAMPFAPAPRSTSSTPSWSLRARAKTEGETRGERGGGVRSRTRPEVRGRVGVSTPLERRRARGVAASGIVTNTRDDGTTGFVGTAGHPSPGDARSRRSRPRDVDARSTRTSSVTDSETPRAGRTRALPPLRVVGDGGEGGRRCARVVSEKARGRENETRMTGTEIAEAGRSRALRVADAPGEGFAR